MNAGESERFHKDFEHALAFATRLHALQKRKKTDIPQNRGQRQVSANICVY